MTALRARDVLSVNLSNPRHDVTRRQQRAALRTLVRRHHPAVIATQEARAGLRAPRGYRKVQGPGGLSELAVFVKRRLQIAGHGAHRSVAGKAGHWPDRGLVWVQLGDGLVVINVHPNSGIDAGGRPRDGAAWDVTRGAHFPDIDAAVQLHSRTGRAVVVGDWNIDGGADHVHRVPEFPASRLGRLGMAEATYPGGSLGGRAVDRAFYERAQLTAAAQLLDKTAPWFDHRPILIRVRFR